MAEGKSCSILSYQEKESRTNHIQRKDTTSPRRLNAVKAEDEEEKESTGYLLSSIGHLKSLHLLHHVLGCCGDAGRHVVDKLGDLLHIRLDVTLGRDPSLRA